MPGTEAWSPWLGSVFVAPQYRGWGVGAALVEAVVSDAAALGYPRIHLLTTEAEGWYTPKGWRILEPRSCAGLPAVIMGLDLAP
jgi:N-acetylglutamate synthase-like GNAT family acetyltransferase